MNKLIKQREDEHQWRLATLHVQEFKRYHTEKINDSPFTQQINTIRATIEKQLRKMRELEQQEKDWNDRQQELKQLQDEYNDAYGEYYSYDDNKVWYDSMETLFRKDKPAANTFHKIEFMSEPYKRISRANSFPFDTIIRLDNLTDDERNEMGIRLKEFYDKNIKSQPIDSKILVGYFVDGEWMTRPISNESVRKVLENMLKGDYVFSCDSVNTIVNFSDPETFISLSFIDAIKFQIVTDDKVEGERNREKPSGFFPYRLKPEYKQFEVFLNELAIGCDLYDYDKKCMQSWLKQCCLVYAISQIYPNETELLENINRLLNGSVYIAADKLTEIGNTFSIQFIVRSRDNKEGKLQKGNKANDGLYGPKDAKYKVEIDRIEYHYFIHKMYPCSTFFIKNYDEVMDYGKKHGWNFNKCCLAYKRRGQNILTETAKAKISSIDLVALLMEIGAFEKILRSDRDVDLAGVHEWLNKDANTTETIKEIQDYNIKKLEKPKETYKIPKDQLHYFYADFETCTRRVHEHGECTKNDQEVAFMVCIQSIKGRTKKTFKGFNCAEQLMEFLPDMSIVYFHNLGFDGRLLWI